MLLQNLNTSYHIWVNLIFFTRKCQQNPPFIEIQWKSPNILLLFSLPFKLIIIDEITKQKFFCGKVGLEVYKGRFNVCLLRHITIIFPWWKCDRIVDNIQSRLNVLISLCDQHCNAKKWQCKEAHNDFKRYSHCARRYTKVITLHGKGKNIIEWKKKTNFK